MRERRLCRRSTCWILTPWWQFLLCLIYNSSVTGYCEAKSIERWAVVLILDVFQGNRTMLFLKGQLAVWIHFVCIEVTLFSRNRLGQFLFILENSNKVPEAGESVTGYRFSFRHVQGYFRKMRAIRMITTLSPLIASHVVFWKRGHARHRPDVP